MAEITELKGLVTKLLPVKLLENNNGQIEGVPKNPRFIKDWRYKLLLQSLTESPEMLSLKELWVYKVGNIYVVIAGNMRLRGSKEKGYKSLPCKILPPETSVEKLKEYAIKDNAGYGDWEMDSLANEWESPKIVEWGVELHGWEKGLTSSDDLFKPKFNPETMYGNVTEDEINKQEGNKQNILLPTQGTKVICPHCLTEFEIK